jgi:hypothetical protein
MRSSETSVDFQQTTRGYIPGDRTPERDRDFALHVYAVILDILMTFSTGHITDHPFV